MLYRALIPILASVLTLTCLRFINPIKSVNGSDPFMVYRDGYYYLTSKFGFYTLKCFH